MNKNCPEDCPHCNQDKLEELHEKTTYTEWETIDDELWDEAGVGECIQVSSTKDYMGDMEIQNKKVLAYLTNKYPARRFKLSKWNPHDFGAYQEVLEAVEYEYDYEENEE